MPLQTLSMGFKHHTASEVPGLRYDPNYARQLRGVTQTNFSLAFFAIRNSILCTALGCWQLLHLYLAYIALRVSLRVLKHKGVDVRKIKRFTFRWKVSPELELDGKNAERYCETGALTLELLNYSNVFNDYYWAKTQGLELRNDDKLPRFTLANAATQPDTRLHDVRKDKLPLQEGSQACDSKWVRFMDLLMKCETLWAKAMLLCVWITTRHIGAMEAASRGDAIPSGWKAAIPVKARDTGLKRENGDSVGRGASVIKAIMGQKRLTWKQLLDHSKSITDWGRFKAQHLSWNLHAAGLITVVDENGEELDHGRWALPRDIVSDRATFQLASRFTGVLVEDLPCSPAKKRKRKVEAKTSAKRRTASSASAKCGAGPREQEAHAYQDPCGFESEEVSAETLMKFVDRIVYDSRAKIHSSVLQVGIGWEEDTALTWHDVPLADVIPDDPLDHRFALLANFCQIEKLIKIWLPVRSCFRA